ncbi:MAG: endonuclease/exonuclease/phosphatase family protein [Saprospiraceae bacterium]|nr:endonuclease/exonuclease/phosphatase family protein [Candidatus Brachybacter algidus]MBK9023447.1 endonuclease/exonuclease/phosphatase family protein [Candidatus Brachybacter algidus]MBK9396162.1 endonuclease/exonuclease/phosphatase family protein [Candidatus Brachybacter algidus]
MFFFVISLNAIASDTLKLTSFNIRLSSVDDGINNWNLRKPLLKEYLERKRPDVLGVQEALPNQMSYLDSIPGYEYVGVGRDNGMTLGEYSAIFYNSYKLDVKESGTFWLSETSNKPTKGWDAVCMRICTWARFKDKSNKEFYVFNTHFDHMGVKARTESARLIMSKIALVAPGFPVFLSGDFNTEDGSFPIEIIKDFMIDSREAAIEKDRSDGKSFNGFIEDKPAAIKIDFIFIRPNITTLSFQTNQEKPQGRFISDHFPVEGVYTY